MDNIQKLIDLLRSKAKKAEQGADLYEHVDKETYYYHLGKSTAFFAAVDEAELLLNSENEKQR